MANLRALAERDLGRSLEGPDWGMPVVLTAPDGERYATTVAGQPLRGQVLYDIVRMNVDTGEKVSVPTPVVTLRRSSLPRVPEPGETWLVEIPESPLPDAPMVQKVTSGVRPPAGGMSIGFIRLYLQSVEQSDVVEEPGA